MPYYTCEEMYGVSPPPRVVAGCSPAITTYDAAVRLAGTHSIGNCIDLKRVT
jgi:hypothetical protein